MADVRRVGVNQRQFVGGGASDGPPLTTGFRNTPQSAARVVHNAAHQAFADGQLDVAQVVQTVDKSRFLNFQNKPLTLVNQESQVLLLEPTSLRAYLYVRNSANSTGSIGISLNQEIANIDNASWILNPGDDSASLWQFIIPQNRLFVFCDGGSAIVQLTYAETLVKGV